MKSNKIYLIVSLLFFALSLYYFIDKQIAFGCLWFSQSILWSTLNKNNEPKDKEDGKDKELEDQEDGEKGDDENWA